MKSKLNYFELCLYVVFWTSASFYGLYRVYSEQNDVLSNSENLETSLLNISPGWKILKRDKDTSDIEWSTWKVLFSKLWKHLIFQWIISELLRTFKHSLLVYWYIGSSVLFIAANFRWKHLVIILVQPLIFSTVIFSGGNRISVWLTGLLILVSFNLLKNSTYFWVLIDPEKFLDTELYALMYAFGWILLRCISYCLDYLDRKDKTSYVKNMEKDKVLNDSSMESVTRLFAYVLYLPALYYGPLILYSEFENSLTVSYNLKTRIKTFILNLIFYQIYTLLLDMAFHYIYFLAMADFISLVKQLTTITLSGAGLWMGLEFQTKYVITYGTGSAFALLDHINGPPTPRCIARVHVYSDMWRYFDVGLYRFLVKYIYKPSLSLITKSCNIPPAINKLLASFTTFVFIYIWHGFSRAIFVWTVLNFVSITCEHLGRMTAKTNAYKKFKVSILRSDEMELRFVALLCAPLLCMSAISNFYLFVGDEVGDLFVERTIRIFSYNSLALLFALYSCCQVSMAIQNVPSRTAKCPFSLTGVSPA